MLHPTNFERVNVQLADSATHETTVAALNYYAQSDQHKDFTETAKFLGLVRGWFNIVNVKPASVHVNLNDPLRKPATKEKKEGLRFLLKFGEMLQTWLERKGKGTICPQIHCKLPSTHAEVLSA